MLASEWAFAKLKRETPPHKPNHMHSLIIDQQSIFPNR